VSLFGKNSQLGTIVVVALLMHKAPEAIGFGTFLVDKKCTKAQTLTNLIVSLPKGIIGNKYSGLLYLHLRWQL
jgi:zinc transporter ZupT